MRLNVDRFMQVYTSSLENSDYEQRLAGLRAITLAVGRIASLERICHFANQHLSKYDEMYKTLDGITLDDDIDSPHPETET